MFNALAVGSMLRHPKTPQQRSKYGIIELQYFKKYVPNLKLMGLQFRYKLMLNITNVLVNKHNGMMLPKYKCHGNTASSSLTFHSPLNKNISF